VEIEDFFRAGMQYLVPIPIALIVFSALLLTGMAFFYKRGVKSVAKKIGEHMNLNLVQNSSESSSTMVPFTYDPNGSHRAEEVNTKEH
jgi:hypothetical protein